MQLYKDARQPCYDGDGGGSTAALGAGRIARLEAELREAKVGSYSWFQLFAQRREFWDNFTGS